MTTVPKPDSPASAFTCVWDAWNRLRRVFVDGDSDGVWDDQETDTLVASAVSLSNARFASTRRSPEPVEGAKLARLWRGGPPANQPRPLVVGLYHVTSLLRYFVTRRPPSNTVSLSNARFSRPVVCRSPSFRISGFVIHSSFGFRISSLALAAPAVSLSNASFFRRKPLTRVRGKLCT